MKLSPDIGHKILWFWLDFLKVLFLSFGAGFLFSIGIKHLHEAWKTKNRFKLWLYLSACCFVFYVFLIGIK